MISQQVMDWTDTWFMIHHKIATRATGCGNRRFKVTSLRLYPSLTLSWVRQNHVGEDCWLHHHPSGINRDTLNGYCYNVKVLEGKLSTRVTA
jgi:hypothetical protein